MEKIFFKKTAAILASAVLLASVIGCGNGSTTSEANTSTNNAVKSGQNSSVEGESKNTSGVKQPPWFKEPTAERLEQANQETIEGVNFTYGLDGKLAILADEVQLNDDEISKIKEGKYTAAISMHSMSFDWPQEQVKGLKSEFEKMGIEVIAVTDADFSDSRQISQLETIAAKKPDILVSLPVNPQTTSEAYKKISASGTKIVFMSQAAENMTAGKDYVSVVLPDDFGNGMISADLLAKSLDGKGDVAAIYYAPDYATTNLRYEGFVTRLQAKYPGIKLVDTVGFNDQNDTEGISSALMTKYPKLKGMWVAWSVPAMGAVSAARVSGKNPSDFHIVTEDLGNDVSLEIAQQSFVKGLGAQFPYDMGIVEARLGALALVGGKTYPYIAIPNLGVKRSNLQEAYQKVWHQEPPAEILDALKK